MKRHAFRVNVSLLLLMVLTTPSRGEGMNPLLKIALEMEKCRSKYNILYETYRENNFEIFVMDTDGSEQKNLTNTPKVHEFYPQASPDGRRICFMAYEGEGNERVRCLYLMNHDGTERKKIVQNGRWPCWSPDGSQIAFVRDYLRRFSIKDFATEGLYFYDVKTGEITEHPNRRKIKHIYNLTWHKSGRWIGAVVHGALGQDHAIVILEVKGTNVYRLFTGNRCRPSFSPDGAKITWCDLDWAIGTANLRIFNKQLNPIGYQQVVVSEDHDNLWVYHPDYSPDGRFIVFSQGPVGPDFPVDDKSPGTGNTHHAAIGVKANGWDICVVSAGGGIWIKVTTDGLSNKEPDWIIDIKASEGKSK